MVERPILFSGAMVRAILAGRKTQTRRIVKWKGVDEGLNLGFSGLYPSLYFTDVTHSGWVLCSRGGSGAWIDRTAPTICPYGVPGDRLWVRETFAYHPLDRDKNNLVYRADIENPNDSRHSHYVWKPSIFMPRSASRINLQVRMVRVERLRRICEEDAYAEGVEPAGVGEDLDYLKYRAGFQSLWNDLHKNGWQENPWVWVVEFERC